MDLSSYLIPPYTISKLVKGIHSDSSLTEEEVRRIDNSGAPRNYSGRVLLISHIEGGGDNRP